MKEQIEQLRELIRTNKGMAIRIAGVVLGSVVGVVVASLVVAAQESEFTQDAGIEMDPDSEDTETDPE